MRQRQQLRVKFLPTWIFHSYLKKPTLPTNTLDLTYEPEHSSSGSAGTYMKFPLCNNGNNNNKIDIYLSIYLSSSPWGPWGWFGVYVLFGALS